MGQFMGENDVFIGTFLELANLRFAPRQGSEPEWFGGIDEIVELQKEFQVFQAGRSFQKSAALLGLGGHANSMARAGWFRLLADLRNYPSNKPGQDGDAAIVGAMLQNFALAAPLPVYFMAHDSRPDGARQVIIEDAARPLFYIEQDYVTVSIPMKPRTP